MLVWGFLLLFVMTIKEGVERVVLCLSWNYSSDSRQLDRSIHYKLPLHNSLSLQETNVFLLSQCHCQITIFGDRKYSLSLCEDGQAEGNSFWLKTSQWPTIIYLSLITMFVVNTQIGQFNEIELELKTFFAICQKHNFACIKGLVMQIHINVFLFACKTLTIFLFCNSLK